MPADLDTCAATLTPEARSCLSTTIRTLRERLIADLDAAAESAYRLSIPADRAGLSESARVRRARLERAIGNRDRAAKEAAATLVNRLVLLRHLEALGLRKIAVVTGGFASKGYKEFRQYAGNLLDDETAGYALLLRLVFDELAVDLPGLFADLGIARLFPVPPATLRAAVEALDNPALASAWTDDTTLGWVYQYWNDPEREALDKKIKDGGKVAPHEIAAKTQMFTERYMVEWLLHNSLGLLWLTICKKNGWRADVEEVLPDLEARRAEWRGKRERGEVLLDALLPIAPGLEDRWKYYVPQPIPEDAVLAAPASIRDVKLLDPACGSGHFLVIAFDLLAALYREEARHRGETSTDEEIAASIIERNLHGVDIDPRAVQIAAAALYVKAQRLAPGVPVRDMNLVAPALHLGRLPPDDPALAALRSELRASAGIPEALTNQVIAALATVDHWGTLLKVDTAIDDALTAHEREGLPAEIQRELFRDVPVPARQAPLPFERARASLLDRLERFLAQHTSEADLGLRLDGEELAAGVRFIRIVKEGQYDIVVGNPPYQGASRMADTKYLAATYPRAKADLYAAFLERGLLLAKPGGYSALLTMRGWMFLAQFRELREHLLKTFDLRSIGDVDRGAFEDVPNDVLAAAMTILRRAPPADVSSVATQPFPFNDTSYDRERTKRKRAAVLTQVGRFEFRTRDCEVIEGEPVVFWWPRSLLQEYAALPKLETRFPGKNGMSTQDNTRFLRRPWEVAPSDTGADSETHGWAPYIKGGEGRAWFEPMLDIVRWLWLGLEPKTFCQLLYRSHSRTIKNEALYFRKGVAFSVIGSFFSGRMHRVASVFGHMGASIFPDDCPGVACLLNTSRARFILQSLNPGIHFLVSDVNRLPIFPVESASDIYATLDRAFTDHEAARETSIEFRRPGPSPWRAAQSWAQAAVDRAAGAPLPPYVPEYDPPRPIDFVSFAVGVALGRFAANGEGILADAPSDALPAGILYVSAVSSEDALAHAACAPLHTAWAEHGPAVGGRDDLRTFLRRSFFADHKARYENRPIYLPLSSAKKSFVAWVSIHCFAADTLGTLLSDWLVPERRRLEGEVEDLKKARHSPERKTANAAEKRYAEVQKLTRSSWPSSPSSPRSPSAARPSPTRRHSRARRTRDSPSTSTTAS